MNALPSSHLSLRRYGASPGSHAHAHYQVLWGWRGVLELEVDGRGARMTTGRAAIIPPGARHDFWAAASDGRAAQCFVLDTADPQLEPLAGRVVDTPAPVAGLLGFLQTQDAVGLQEAVPLLLRGLASLAPVPAHTARGRRIDWSALQAWVDGHLSQPLDVARLAARVHLSPSQFTARCVEQWGVPPLAWVRARRLAAARGLRRDGMAVGEVALRCGYRSPSALTAALRRAG